MWGHQFHYRHYKELSDSIKHACQVYSVECVSKIKSILWVFFYAIYGAVCKFTHFSFDDCDSMWEYFDGLLQDCSNSICNALEVQQSCTKAIDLSYYHHKIKNMIP